MKIGVPQAVWIVIQCFSLGVFLAKHGEPKNETYNFWAALISVVVTAVILKWGGFF